MTKGMRRGFTLLEPLVVISIIAVLGSLLLPTMSEARDAARISKCLVNLGMVAVASSLYQDDGDDSMPVRQPYGFEGGRGNAWSNFNHGGRYPVEGSTLASFCVLPFDRMLNKYAHPTLPRGGREPRTPEEWDSPNGRMDPGLSGRDFMDPKRFNFPIFECPADAALSANYQEGVGRIFVGPRSCYHAIGRSYLFSTYWYYTLTGHPRRNVTWNWPRGVKMFSRARSVYPSQFIAYFDDPFDATFWAGRPPEVTHHGRADVNSVSFLDAHAEQIRTEYDAGSTLPKYNTAKFFLVFPEYLR